MSKFIPQRVTMSLLALCPFVTTQGENVITELGQSHTPKAVTMENVVDLSTLTTDYVAQDGDVLTDTLATKVKISAAAGATITLRNSFESDEPVSNLIRIDNTGASTQVIYTIDGRRLNSIPVRKGLYIINGKKVLCK